MSDATSAAPAPAPAAPAQAQQTQAPAHPDLTKPPAAPGDAPRPAHVYVDAGQWQTIQEQLAAFEGYKKTQAQLLEAKEHERVKALAEKGQVDEALKQTRTSYETKIAKAVEDADRVTGAWLSEKKNAVLAEAMTGLTFTGVDPQKTASMVRRLLEDEVEAVRDAEGNPVVRCRKTFRPAAETLREQLNSPDFSAFLAANHRGGAGTDGARPAANHDDPYSAWASDFRRKKEEALKARF